MIRVDRTALLTRSGLRALCCQIPYSPETPVFRTGTGVWLEDDEGRRFLDAISGIFVTSLGYGCTPIIEAMSRQLQALAFSPPLHGLHEEPMRLAEELVAFAGEPFDCAMLVSGGSECIEAALRVTRRYHHQRHHPQKTKILSNYDSYHGVTYGALSLTARADLQQFEPRLPGFFHVWPSECLACPFDKTYPQCGITCVSAIEKTIVAEGSDTVGAIVIEPMIHLLGMVVPPPEYFAELRAICDRHDVLLIFDEIVTGCGRTGKPFAAQTFGVVPDILCLGKSLSGGYAPLAAMLMSERVSSTLRRPDGTAAFAPSHTYSNNPVSCAAGRAALSIIGQLGTLVRVREAEQVLVRSLTEAIGGRGQLRGRGLLYGVKLDTPPGAVEVGKAVELGCRDRRVIVRGESDWIVLAPAYTITDAQIGQITSTIGDVLDSIWHAA